MGSHDITHFVELYWLSPRCSTIKTIGKHLVTWSDKKWFDGTVLHTSIISATGGQCYQVYTVFANRLSNLSKTKQIDLKKAFSLFQQSITTSFKFPS